MSKEFLSQDEVDALLKGVSGEVEEPVAEEPQDGGVRPYNLATEERIVRARMPTFEMVNERFARQLRPALFNFLRRNADVTISAPRVQKFSDFVRNLVVPTNLNLVQIKPLRGSSLVIFDPNLVFLVVDSLFGGTGQFITRVEGRDFTQTEMRIIQRMLEIVFEEYEKSWKPVHEIKLEYVRSEMNTQFASIATPNDVVIVTTLNIEFGPAGGEMHICIPYTSLEPLRGVLYSSMQSDPHETDKRWFQQMQREVQNAEVEVVVNLGRTALTLEQILNMQTGDVIGIEVPETMLAEVDGVPVMECKCGVYNGQYAVRVERMVSHANES
ncbi:MAG: flagellar motor switch protein FliM [Betaproteobacteria bacterium]|nr:MAG: flagellar motor switch protein FliM [Betaproteobacteria bacterium]